MAGDESGGAAVDVRHEAAVAAEVNAPATVTLYSEDGRPLAVPAADVDHWLRQGMARERFDPKDAAQALKLALREAGPLVDAYVKGVLADGSVDTADAGAAAAAERALAEVVDQWRRLHQGIGTRYPTRANAAAAAEAQEAAQAAQESGK